MSPSVPIREATIETIGEWMSGLWPGGPKRMAGEDLNATEVAHA
jgi:simple sugar transport system ATP-binding protein